MGSYTNTEVFMMIKMNPQQSLVNHLIIGIKTLKNFYKHIMSLNVKSMRNLHHKINRRECRWVEFGWINIILMNTLIQVLKRNGSSNALNVTLKVMNKYFHQQQVMYFAGTIIAL